MESLKKNLHFAVFGACALVGLILAGVAFMVKSGKVDGVEEMKGKLDKLGVNKLPTKGDLARAEATRNSFNDEMTGALAHLQSKGGIALRSGLATHNNATQYYSYEAEPILQNLQKRFAVLEGTARSRPGSRRPARATSTSCARCAT
jgi:hypothetical protein